jgi:hypothetical protein
MSDKGHPAKTVSEKTERNQPHAAVSAENARGEPLAVSLTPDLIQQTSIRWRGKEGVKGVSQRLSLE